MYKIYWLHFGKKKRQIPSFKSITNCKSYANSTEPKLNSHYDVHAYENSFNFSKTNEIRNDRKRKKKKNREHNEI